MCHALSWGLPRQIPINCTAFLLGSTCRVLRHAAEGKSYEPRHYNLEVIIAVGYRVKSPRGTQFRQWATARLSEAKDNFRKVDDMRWYFGVPCKGNDNFAWVQHFIHCICRSLGEGEIRRASSGPTLWTAWLPSLRFSHLCNSLSTIF